MNSGENKTYLSKYKVETFVVMNGAKKLEMDHTNILSIEYLCDYEFNIFAMLKVTLRIDSPKRMEILKNKKDITVKFSLNKIGMDADLEENIISTEAIWDVEFGVYFNDEDDSIDPDIMKDRIELNEDGDYSIEDSESYHDSQNTIDLYLFHSELLKSSRKVVNRVFTETTLQNAVGAILTETKHKEVLMSKFENDTVYKELIIPVNPAYKALIYLDQYMGFFKEGSVIFYDIDTVYILNANGEITATRDKEITETVFIVTKLDNSIPGNGMKRVPGEQVYYPVISEMDVNPQRFSISKNVELGSEAKLVLTDSTDISIEEADQSFINERNEKILFTQSENKFQGSIIKKRMEENEVILYINGENLDINAFKPNKTYKIFFEDTSKYEKFSKNGYRIAFAYHYLKAESEAYMSASHRIMLKKSSGSVAT